ncbi:MAG: GNAT family N-acetyltransferase, partial [Ilumatobacteraceae bacterium]
MTTTLAFALRAALPTDVEFEQFLYASTREDLRPLGPEVFDGLIGMQFRAQTMSIKLDHPRADRKIVLVDDVPVGRLVVD